jgi:hypothetical protein
LTDLASQEDVTAALRQHKVSVLWSMFGDKSNLPEQATAPVSSNSSNVAAVTPKKTPVAVGDEANSPQWATPAPKPPNTPPKSPTA